MSAYVVTVIPTIMDGTVVRWCTNEAALDNHDHAISASRNGVIGGNGHTLTPELFDAAWAAHLAIKAGVDVKHLATHRLRSLLGPFERIEQA